MTQLEKTIKQILSERQRTANQDRTRSEIENAVDQRTRQYNEEFDSIYKGIDVVKQIEKEFVEWADQCTIDDAREEVTNGAGFYQHLLQKAHSAYQRFREEGYEPQTAFDKGTSNLTRWIEDSTQKAGGGTIYLNYSQQFLSRMRKMSW
ncbi:MAG: hypothetical protein KJ597_01780 [Nanoarchaeota archaeon]|nr:hypothetical protein [Nanoarchaeota archaeon]MBU1622281.1 hypothetical protein [Nanoarchaeota archaeon]